MRGSFLSLVLGLGVGPLAAASPGLDDDPSPATVAYQAILSEYDTAMTQYRQAFADLRATPEYQEASRKRDRDAMAALTQGIQAVDAGVFAQRQLDAARPHAASEDAIPGLSWAMQYTRSDEVRTEALDLLLANHADSEAMLPFARNLYRMGRGLGAEGCAKAMEALMTNPSKEVQAHALYGWAYQIVNDRSGEATAEMKAEAQAAMQRVKELAPNSSCALRIDAPEFEKSRLQIGMQVPDIEGHDLDGVAFKLSDYRGKVVVLDFWGDW